MARDLPEARWLEGSSRWRLRVQRDGVRRDFYSSLPGRRGQRECEGKAIAWIDGTAEPSSSRLVSEVCADWLAEVRDTISETEYRLYEPCARLYILPRIGKMRMRQLTNEQMFQDIISAAYRNGNGGQGLSRASLLNLRGTISAFLRYCRKSGLTTLRPENLAIPKRAARASKSILQPDDLRTLFASDATSERGRVVPEWHIHAFRFHVLTGLRPGELIGLEWGDVRDGVVSIRRSVNKCGETTPCKNANARRAFLLPRRAMDELEAQREMLKAHGVESPHVFPAPDGNPPSQDTYRGRLRRYCAHNHMTVVTPYELRHTWYSVNKGLPAELVKRMGGHSESMDTFGVYGHDVDGDRERTARLMDGVMDGLLSPPPGGAT